MLLTDDDFLALRDDDQVLIVGPGDAPARGSGSGRGTAGGAASITTPFTDYLLKIPDGQFAGRVKGGGMGSALRCCRVPFLVPFFLLPPPFK